MAAFNTFASKNPHLIKIAPSQAERHSDAMWLVDDIARAPEALQTQGEFAHIHGTGDHSAHVVLSASDAKKVIDAGWGQRHGFAGYRPLGSVSDKIVNIPATYLLIYAPRNQKEIEVVMEIVRASLRHVSLGKDVIS